MSQPSAEDVQVLRDRIGALLDEQLPEEHLAALWPSIETEWLGLFPETEGLLHHLRHRTATFRATDRALETLLQVCDRHLESLHEAAGYRRETEDLKRRASELLRWANDALKK